MPKPEILVVSPSDVLGTTVFPEATIPITAAFTGEEACGALVETNQFIEAALLCYILHLAKAPQYKRSWCKRGLTGMFFTVVRKWDRLEELFKDGADPLKSPGEALEETVIDLAVYFVKWVGWLKEKHPERYNSMRDRVFADFNKVNSNGLVIGLNQRYLAGEKDWSKENA